MHSVSVMNSPAQAPEEQFEFELEHFRNEVSNSICLYCVPRATAYAAEDRAVRRALNETALLWNLSATAHQQALFVTLGRIFDQSTPHNIDRVVGFGARHLEIFSRAALAVRKRAGSTEEPEWLEAYLAEAFEPTVDDFRVLRRAVNEQRVVYQERFDPIRDRYIAHREVARPEAIADLFSQAEIAALEELLSTLRAIHDALQNLYLNGTRMELRRRPLEIERLIRTPLGELHRSWDVELAVYDVRRCLELLVSGMPTRE